MADNSIRLPLAVADANVPSIMVHFPRSHRLSNTNQIQAPSASKHEAAEIEDDEEEDNILVT
jgi:hypothetical protein